MSYLVSIMLVLVGIIHLLPLTGVLGSEQLSRLYGLRFDEPNLAILMRHRAVLFGLLGAFLVYAAFQPSLQTIGLIAAFVSVASFIRIAWSVGEYNAQLRTVFWVDVVAIACIAIGAFAKLAQR